MSEAITDEQKAGTQALNAELAKHTELRGEMRLAFNLAFTAGWNANLARQAAEIDALRDERGRLRERMFKISEDDPFPRQFGDGTVLTGLPPNDIFQFGYAAAFNACFAALEEKQNENER